MSREREEKLSCDMIREVMAIECAAGTLSYEKTLLIKACASMCDETRNAINLCEDLGGRLIEKECDPCDMSEGSLDSVMARLEQAPAKQECCNHHGHCQKDAFDGMDVPDVILEYINGMHRKVRWHNLRQGIRTYHLNTPSKHMQMYIVDMKPGTAIPEHNHKGKEYTLVVRGAFRDGENVYQRGSFVVQDQTDTHQPEACKTQGCVCVVLLDEAMRFTHWPFRALNIFLR